MYYQFYELIIYHNYQMFTNMYNTIIIKIESQLKLGARNIINL